MENAGKSVEKNQRICPRQRVHMWQVGMGLHVKLTKLQISTTTRSKFLELCKQMKCDRNISSSHHLLIDMSFSVLYQENLYCENGFIQPTRQLVQGMIPSLQIKFLKILSEIATYTFDNKIGQSMHIGVNIIHFQLPHEMSLWSSIAVL